MSSASRLAGVTRMLSMTPARHSAIRPKPTNIPPKMPSCTSMPGHEHLPRVAAEQPGHRLQQRAEQHQVEDRLGQPDDHPGRVAQREPHGAGEDDPGVAQHRSDRSCRTPGACDARWEPRVVVIIDLSGRGLVAQRPPGQGQEDVVEGRPVHLDPGQRDVLGIELAEQAGSTALPSGTHSRTTRPSACTRSGPPAGAGRALTASATALAAAVWPASARVTATLSPETECLSSSGVPVATSDAVVDHHDPVAERVRLVQVVRGQEDRGAEVVAQAAHVLPEVGPRLRVEPAWSARRGRRARAGGSGPSRCPAVAAARRRGSWSGGSQTPSRSSWPEQVGAPGAGLGRRAGRRAGRGRPAPRRPGPRGSVEPDWATYPIRRRTPTGSRAQVAAGDGRRAGGRLEQGGEHPQRRGLAGAVRAEEADDLALGHLEVDALHGVDAWPERVR